jgi:hypothetical protein
MRMQEMGRRTSFERKTGNANTVFAGFDVSYQHYRPELLTRESSNGDNLYIRSTTWRTSKVPTTGCLSEKTGYTCDQPDFGRLGKPPLPEPDALCRSLLQADA